MKATLFKHEDITTWCYPMKQIQRRDPDPWPAERRSQLGHAGQGVRLKRLGQRNDGWMWQPSHWSPPLSTTAPIPPAPALFHTVLRLPFSEKHRVIFYSPSTKKKKKTFTIAFREKMPKLLITAHKAVHHSSPGILSKAFSSFSPVHPWHPSNLESHEEPVDSLCVDAYLCSSLFLWWSLLPFIWGALSHLDDSAQS